MSKDLNCNYTEKASPCLLNGFIQFCTTETFLRSTITLQIFITLLIITRRKERQYNLLEVVSCKYLNLPKSASVFSLSYIFVLDLSPWPERMHEARLHITIKPHHFNTGKNILQIQTELIPEGIKCKCYKC